MGSRWGRVFWYTLMCALGGWNLYNLFHSTGTIYNHSGLLGAGPYALICLIGVGWCVFAMVIKYQKDNKRKSKS